MKNKNSPMTQVRYDNFDLYIKRDDLLHKEFSGNKARKFHHFLEHDFKGIEKIISYGSAQANSLYSLSVLAKLKGVSLDFYVYPIASYLKENPAGNYKVALQNGANIIEIDHALDKQVYIENEILPQEKNSIFIEEGGRIQEAKEGLKILADEIKQWVNDKGFNDIKVMLPSGTGTTALFLQKYLPYEVLTVTCVADENYLKSQFIQLNSNTKEHPTILPRTKKYHFGKLYKEFYEEYKYLLEQTKIEFDLLYDPLGFIALKNYLQTYDKANLPTVIYIHQGGLLGNPTMIERYERKYNIK